MVVTVEDIRIELQIDELTTAEQDYIQKKINYYTERAEKIAPESQESIKDEYVTAAVLRDYKTNNDASSFSDGRFTININTENIIKRYKKALHLLYKIKIFRPPST